MTESFPSLTELLAEERGLQFSSFTNDDAWELGCDLVELAQERAAPVAIEIQRSGHVLFHAALPGATPDNDDWIRRKANVVQRFSHSSLAVRQASVERGITFEEEFGLDPLIYAAHGGAFPVIARSVGPVGVVAVSGLPQVEDHRLVVAGIRAFLSAR